MNVEPFFAALARLGAPCIFGDLFDDPLEHCGTVIVVPSGDGVEGGSVGDRLATLTTNKAHDDSPRKAATRTIAVTDRTSYTAKAVALIVSYGGEGLSPRSLLLRASTNSWAVYSGREFGCARGTKSSIAAGGTAMSRWPSSARYHDGVVRQEYQPGSRR